MTSSALIVSLSVNRIPHKLAPKVPSSILRNPPFCSFASFLIVSLTPFLNKPDSSRDLTIFMISFISSFEIISIVTCEAKYEERRPDPNTFLRIAASAAANHNVIKTLLVNGLNTFFLKGKPIFSNGPKSLPRNSPDFPTLCN